jgi:hypothetical protein
MDTGFMEWSVEAESYKPLTKTLSEAYRHHPMSGGPAHHPIDL